MQDESACDINIGYPLRRMTFLLRGYLTWYSLIIRIIFTRSSAGSLPLCDLVTGTYPLGATQEAFDRLAAGGAMKVLVEVRA